jgi:hypothetical protein
MKINLNHFHLEWDATVDRFGPLAFLCDFISQLPKT